MESLLSYLVTEILSGKFNLEIQEGEFTCSVSSPYYAAISDNDGNTLFMLSENDVAEIRHLAAVLDYDEELQEKVEYLNETIKKAGF